MTHDHDRFHAGAARPLTRREALRLALGAAAAGAAAAALPLELHAQASLCPGVTGTQLKAFNPPACVRDFQSAVLQQRLEESWSRNVNQWTEQAIVGNPWGSNLDFNRAFYFNPLTTPIPAKSLTKLIEWIAFPNRITSYLAAPKYSFSQAQLFEFADNGRLSDGTPLPWIPDNVCPYIDSAPLPAKPYGPAGPRGWQDEYCEWAVQRNAQNEIVRVSFTCENPEYWHTLWSVDENRVLELYRQLVNPRVQLADLYLRDASGKIVHDPFLGRPAYNPLNKWNNSTQALADSGGAVHLTSPPNNLGAEIGLGAAATLLRFMNQDPQTLICCTPYGQSFRHSDPHIGFTVNAAVQALGQRVTIADPVGLYIQEPDFENYELPPDAVKAGLKPKDFWRLVRGVPGMGLHAVFQAPKGYEWVKLGGIKINGQPLRWGAQITQTFQIGLRGTFIDAGSTPAQTALACPNSESPAPNRPSPQQLLPLDVLRAYQESGNSGVSSTAAPVARRGQTLKDVALVTTGTTADTAVVFPPGITTKVKAFIQNQRYHVPGNTNAGTFNIFVLDIEVGPDAPLGQLPLRLGTGFNVPAPAFLTVQG